MSNTMEEDYKTLLNLSECSSEQRNIALRKYNLIKPFLEWHQTLASICVQNKLSLRTAREWVANYRSNGFVGLLRKPRNDKGRSRCCSKELHDLIEGIYLKMPHLSMASIYKKIKEYALRQNFLYPSYRSCCTIIKQIPKDLTFLAHEGSKKYKEKYDLLYMRESNSSNEIWQADHALLDIFIKDHSGSSKRPWLTIVFDDYSRAIAGYQLSFLSPSSLKTSLALRQAIWYKKEPDWSICGIPATLYTDHGSDFTSKHIEQVCLDLKTNLIFSQIGQPRGRGKIERFFLTLNQMCLSLLDGYTQNKKTTPKLTLAELDEIIRNFIKEYNNRFEPKYPFTPQERWQHGRFIPNMPTSLEQLDLLLLTVAKPRKIRRDGIHFQGLRYIDPVLASHVNEHVIIRYDPADITEIRVFYQNKYLCRPVCQDLATHKVGLKEIQKARNDRKKALDQQVKQRISLVDAVLKSKATNLDTIKTNKPTYDKKLKTKLKLYEVDV